jgi:dipeptidase E
MTRYYFSGFDNFEHGLGKMFQHELKNTKSIVYIPGDTKEIEKTKTEYLPMFADYFKQVGIEFETVNLITPDLSKSTAKEMIKNASFVMLMGGCPFKQKELCEKLGIMDELKKYDGVMMGFSAGAMLMSKYIIITPCSEEYPDFRIEPGLDLDGISIYPHNNTADTEYPDELVSGDETYKKSDLIQVAKQYGQFYLLQDNECENGSMDVSLIKSSNGKIEFYTENDGKIWVVDKSVEMIFGPQKE